MLALAVLLLFQFKQPFVAGIFSSFQVSPKPMHQFSFSRTLRNLSTTSLKLDCPSCLRSCSSGSGVLPVEESCLHPPNRCLLIPAFMPQSRIRHSPWDSPHPFQIIFSYNTLAHSVPAMDVICPQVFDFSHIYKYIYIKYIFFHIDIFYIHTRYIFAFVHQSHYFIYEGKSIVEHL